MTSAANLLEQLGVSSAHIARRGGMQVTSPIDGATLAHISPHMYREVDRAIADAHEAFLAWRAVPAPRRGELVRVFGDVLRENKRALGQLVTREAGKIVAEAEGEVPEMIAICDFACGLSRQLHGLTIAS